MRTPPSRVTEFHVSRAARDRYGFDEAAFTRTGNVVFADYAAARRFAQAINSVRDVASNPGEAVRAGDINAMGLLDEILHYVVELYRRERNPDAISGALAALENRLTKPVLDEALVTFAEHFPTVAAYRGDVSAADYVAGETGGTPNREIVLEELLMLWLSNENPGYAPFRELFDDGPLEEGTAYEALVAELSDYFKAQPGMGPDDEDLITLLRRPATDGGQTLAEQLRWVDERWGFAAEKTGDRLVIGLDVLSEDERAVWMRFHASQGGVGETGRADSDSDSDSAALHGFDMSTGPGGTAGAPGSAAAARASEPDPEFEMFSQDLDWMPQVVLLAKSTYVWLDQLSRALRPPDLATRPDPRRGARHARRSWVHRPVADRAVGAQQGLEGDQAAARQPRGSRIGLFAHGLPDRRRPGRGGGLRQPARPRVGARHPPGAATWCPNHMGIDSRWVVEHPDWFMQRPDTPYPVYSFAGPEPLHRRARRYLPRGSLLRQHRRRGGLQAPGPLERSGAVHLSRERRHIDAVERHGAARLPEARRARGRHPDDPGTSRDASRSSASTPR